jgi:hypothetical protein
MPFRGWIAAAAIIALGVGEAVAADVETVAPGGPGILTICRDWLVAASCKTYHHIALPPQIAIGDRIPLSFGSNRKEYTFPVARIALKDRHCAIFSEATGDRHQMNKINVSPCYRAERGREGHPPRQVR